MFGVSTVHSGETERRKSAVLLLYRHLIEAYNCRVFSILCLTRSSKIRRPDASQQSTRISIIFGYSALGSLHEAGGRGTLSWVPILQVTVSSYLGPLQGSDFSVVKTFIATKQQHCSNLSRYLDAVFPNTQTPVAPTHLLPPHPQRDIGNPQSSRPLRGAVPSTTFGPGRLQSLYSIPASFLQIVALNTLAACPAPTHSTAARDPSWYRRVFRLPSSHWASLHTRFPSRFPPNRDHLQRSALRSVNFTSLHPASTPNNPSLHITSIQPTALQGKVRVYMTG